MYKWILLLILLPSVALGQYVTPSTGGNADSMGVDSDGNGTIDSYLYSTTGPAFVLQKGSNITFTVDTDTLLIEGAAGSGTADSIGVDTDGDGTVDNFLYSTAGAVATIRESTGMNITVDTDTLYLAVNIATTSTQGIAQFNSANFGVAAGDVTIKSGGINSDEVLDQTLTEADIDSTNNDFVVGGIYKVTSAEPESAYITAGSTYPFKAGQTPTASDLIYIDGDDSLVWQNLFGMFRAGYVDSNATGDTVFVALSDSTDLSVFDTDDLAEGSTNLYRDDIKADTAGDGTNVATITQPLILQEGANITLTVDANGDTVTIAGGAGSGTADSMQADTSGSGNFAQIYSTSGYAFTIREGSNIDLTADNDTLYIAATGGSGTGDSMQVDTSGSGNYAQIYSTSGYAYTVREGNDINLTADTDTMYVGLDTSGFLTMADFRDSIETFVATDGATFADTIGHLHIKEGANVTLTVDTDTLYIAGSAGAGTADSVQMDTSGSGDFAVMYSTAGPVLSLREGAGIDFTADTDTGYIAATLGTAIDNTEITDQTIVGNDVDSTSEDFVFDAAYEGTSAEADSQYSTHNFVRVEIEDSLNEYSLTTAIEALIEDSLNEYSLTTAIAAGYVAKADSNSWDEISDKLIINQASMGNASDSTEADSAIATLGYVQIIAGDSARAYDDFSELSGQVADAQIADGAVDGGTGGEIADNSIDSFDVDETANYLWSGTQTFTGTMDIQSTALTIDSAYFDGNVNIDSIDVTGVADFAGAVNVSGATIIDGASASLEIPNGANPTTNAEGEIAWDANDDAIEVYSGDEGESGLIPFYKKIGLLISQPDSVQAYSDSLPIFHANALMFPFGIEIDLISLTFEVAPSSYTVVFQEWSSATPPVYENVTTSITATSVAYVEEAPDTDGNLDAGNRLYMVLPTTDVPSVLIEVYYHVTEGN